MPKFGLPSFDLPRMPELPKLGFSLTMPSLMMKLPHLMISLQRINACKKNVRETLLNMPARGIKSLLAIVEKSAPEGIVPPAISGFDTSVLTEIKRVPVQCPPGGPDNPLKLPYDSRNDKAMARNGQGVAGLCCAYSFLGTKEIAYLATMADTSWYVEIRRRDEDREKERERERDG